MSRTPFRLFTFAIGAEVQVTTFSVNGWDWPLVRLLGIGDSCDGWGLAARATAGNGDSYYGWEWRLVLRLQIDNDMQTVNKNKGTIALHTFSILS